MSESDTKMLLELGQPQSQLHPASLLLSLGLSNDCCLLGTTLSSAYMKQYYERLIMTKPSISNSYFHLWCKFCFPRFDVLTVVLMRIWVCCTVTLISGSHHSEGPNCLHLPFQGSVLCHVTNYFNSGTAEHPGQLRSSNSIPIQSKQVQSSVYNSEY